MKRTSLTILMTAAAWSTACCLATACVTQETRQGASFATGFDTPESSAVLIDWSSCTEKSPCINGDAANGAPYKLGFKGSPSVVYGKAGDKVVKLDLEPESLFRLGDHALEMLFADKKGNTVLALTWNERDQRPVSSELVLPD